MTETLEEYITRQKKRNPIAARILHKIYAALAAAGDPIVTVYDGETHATVATRKDVDMQVFNLTDAFLITKSGGWVRFIPENEWDAISDYTIRLEAALAPATDYVEKYGV